MDSRYSHANWAADLGGVSYPLLSDFNPKGEVAHKYGVYLEKAGITDRATIIVDEQGVVRYAASVGPGGRRNIEELLEAAKSVEQGRTAPRSGGGAAGERPALSADATLFVRDGCQFCRSVLRAVTNLHCAERVKVRNVTQDPSARAELDRLAGQPGAKVPALVQDGKVQFESADIIATLARCYAR